MPRESTRQADHERITRPLNPRPDDEGDTMTGKPEERITDTQQAGGRVDRQRSRLAQQGRRLRRLERLLLEQAATLDLHSEALLLLIRQQLGASQAGPEPTSTQQPPARFDSESASHVRLPRVG
jgi:hypothetical protein